MQVARSLAPEENAMRELLRVLLLVGPPALAAALGGGYWLARRALAPVDRMTRDADQITATRLNVRLPLSGNDDELERLAHTLNRMIERLEHSFQEMQRFTADAAHELRTPLAVIRNTAEVALRSAREPEEYRHVLENLLEETDQLTRLAGQLLYLCREDSGLNPPANTPVRLDELVREVADQIQIVAREKGLALTVSTPASCQVPGDADRLRRALFNLIDNAVKYTDTGGTISLSVTCNDHYAQIIVADNGRGIASEHVPHIFKRFYRGSGLPKSNSHGTGLGLAICKAIVESHAGRLEVHSKLGEGSQFTILLPTRRCPCPIARPQREITVDRGRE
jgi:heavy metal sensor kinase